MRKKQSSLRGAPDAPTLQHCLLGEEGGAQALTFKKMTVYFALTGKELQDASRTSGINVSNHILVPSGPA